jgi:hypothetical protein
MICTRHALKQSKLAARDVEGARAAPTLGEKIEETEARIE